MREYLRGPVVCNFVRDLEATGVVGLEAGEYTATGVRVVSFKSEEGDLEGALYTIRRGGSGEVDEEDQERAGNEQLSAGIQTRCL